MKKQETTTQLDIETLDWDAIEDVAGGPVDGERINTGGGGG